MIGKPEWIDDPRFRTPAQRSANAAERITLVGEIVKTNTSGYWLERLDAADVFQSALNFDPRPNCNLDPFRP